MALEDEVGEGGGGGAAVAGRGGGGLGGLNGFSGVFICLEGTKMMANCAISSMQCTVKTAWARVT